MEKTGISAIKKRYPHEISGGQQQRVALCRALIRQPLVLLLDEPFSSVDSQMRIRLRQELKKMIKSFGITSIFVTHDKEDAFYMSDRAALMQEGAILQTGDVKTLYQAPCGRDAAGFLGVFNTLNLPGGETISFRPEEVALTSGGIHAGVVTESCFYGFFYQNGIRIYEQDITLYSPAPLQPGQKVSFDITRTIAL